MRTSLSQGACHATVCCQYWGISLTSTPLPCSFPRVTGQRGLQQDDDQQGAIPCSHRPRRLTLSSVCLRTWNKVWGPNGRVIGGGMARGRATIEGARVCRSGSAQSNTKTVPTFVSGYIVQLDMDSCWARVQALRPQEEQNMLLC